MKMKLTPRTKQKMKLGTRLSVAGAVAGIAFSILFFGGPQPPSVQASANNSGKCLRFNGTSSEVTFSHNDLELSSGNTMTVTAWMKWSDKGGNSYGTLVALNRDNGSEDVGQFWLDHDS